MDSIVNASAFLNKKCFTIEFMKKGNDKKWNV